MASFLRKEIQAAVREELSRVISSTGTTANSNSMNPTPETSTDLSRSSVSTSRFAEENSERTLSFDEFYTRREEERQEGFRPPKKRKKKNPSDKATMSAKIVEVEVKVGIASAADGVYTNNLDDFHLKCAIDQILSTQEAPGYDAVQPIKEVQPKSLEEAFEQTLDGFPNEQFTLIEILERI
ncbi:hypothetical protein AWC38_SpisGene14304 [Stylophora pistillata]|uniref:Uncharacterized protein n=1 Tax=Stylophora pistillata TaxID=50429 RepID=A0A2B4RWR5_STYPI|nr:hypothetical protein AWC38_SpisGene14304 [Stylophora pistillata]